MKKSVTPASISHAHQHFWSFSVSGKQQQQQFHQQLPSSKILRKKANREPITYYELLELERERNESLQAATVKVKIKRNFPIAPDGFIPNSVVKKFFKLFDNNAITKTTEKKIWKLKWTPPEILKEENENFIGNESELFNPQEFIMDLSSDEEIKSEIDEDYEGEGELFENESDRFLRDLKERLEEYPWFYLRDKEFNDENIVKCLINKLIERNPENHKLIVNILIEIIKKVLPDLKNWMLSQLEDELDGTNIEIISYNVRLVSELRMESYKLDNAMISLLSPQSPFKSEELKIAVVEYLNNVCNITDNQVETAVENIKLLQNAKYKKLIDFKLKRFIEEYEHKQEALTRKLNLAVEEETESEIFNQILREDWIADQVKESLKNLRDFLNLVLKSLKTVKSKIFYEKLANYTYELYKEFNLANSNWEKLIVGHFLQTNSDTRISEALRLVDLENISKYFLYVKDSEIKSEVLVEMLRSAAIEKSRPQVMENSKAILKKNANLGEQELNNLIEFYEKHSICLTNKNAKFTWQELVHLNRTKPNISDQELFELKGLPPLEIAENVNLSVPENADESSNTNKSKFKSSKKKKRTKGTDKKEAISFSKKERVEAKEIIEISQTKIKENQTTNKKIEMQKRDISIKNVEAKPDNIMKDRQHQIKEKSQIKDILKSNVIDSALNKNQEKEKNKESTSSKESSLEKIEIEKDTIELEQKKKRSEKTSKGKFSILPNNVKGWDFYQKQNDRERKLNDISKLRLTEQHQFLLFNETDQSLNKTDYQKEYEKLQRQAEFEEELELDDRLDFEKIEVASSFDSLIDDDDDAKVRVDKPRRTTPTKSIHKRASSRLILDGITKRVIISQMSVKRKRIDIESDEVRDNLEDFRSTKKEQTPYRFNSLFFDLSEKAHFIDQNFYSEPSFQQSINLKFATLKENRRRQFIEYNKLLECLIIRQLELHDHYQKLLPPVQSHREEFVQMPFFTDFLVVHPYNKKNSYFYNPSVAKIETEQKFKKKEADLSMEQLIGLQQQFSIEGETARIEFLSNSNVFHGLRRRVNKKEHFFRSIDKARIVLISYGAENIREFYSTLNTDLRFYLRRLHTRIPHKIIPLIWNDPVIQKLALILSTSYKLKPQKSKQSNTSKSLILPQIRNLNQDETKSNLVVTNSCNFITTKKEQNIEASFEELKISKHKKNYHPLSYDYSKKKNYPYNLWPLFKQEDSFKTKPNKKKLYFHLMNAKHDNIRLQWRYMLQEDNIKKSNLCFLPPLSLKVNLNTH